MLVITSPEKHDIGSSTQGGYIHLTITDNHERIVRPRPCDLGEQVLIDPMVNQTEIAEDGSRDFGDVRG